MLTYLVHHFVPVLARQNLQYRWRLEWSLNFLEMYSSFFFLILKRYQLNGLAPIIAYINQSANRSENGKAAFATVRISLKNAPYSSFSNHDIGTLEESLVIPLACLVQRSLASSIEEKRVQNKENHCQSCTIVATSDAL